MNPTQEILKRYYRGETSLREETDLKKKWHADELATEPALAYRGDETPLSQELLCQIQTNIQKRKKNQQHRILLLAGSIAAAVVLLIGLRTFFPEPLPSGIQLSDRVKRARFEEAMRVIGNVLDEKATKNEKILYEDNGLIITVE